jgi:hypothetical protein
MAANLTLTYKQIADERPHVCTGCGTGQNLSHSHLIPRSKRKDLEKVKENITYHCLSVGGVGCHEKYDSMRLIELKDFESNMKYIYKADKEFYFSKKHKILDHYTDVTNEKLTQIFNNIENG